VHRWVKVIRRIQVSAVVSRERYPFRGGEPCAIGRLLRGNARKEVLQLGDRLGVLLISDLRAHERRIRDYIVLQRDRKIDKTSRHAVAPAAAAWVERNSLE